MENNTKSPTVRPDAASPAPAAPTTSMGQGRGTDVRPAHSGATVTPDARSAKAGAPEGACDKGMKAPMAGACDKSAKAETIGLADEAGGPLDGAPAVTVPAKAAAIAR